MDVFSLGSTCCFTGHRPEKLPWRYDESDGRCQALKEKLSDVVRAAYGAGIRHFICGMAKGCDLYFAEAVLDLRSEVHGVILEAAIPCESQCHGWTPAEKQRYDYIVCQCDYQTLLQREYTPDCMLKRNRYMVDSSALLIAVFDGTHGGTMQTVNYARKRGLEIIEIRP